MLKKSLTISGIGLLLVMLIALAGCEGPVGPAGSSGPEGPVGPGGENGADGTTPIPPEPSPGDGSVSVGDVTKERLAEFYVDRNFQTVFLYPGVTSVEGVVPEGKKLFVVGSEIKVGLENLIIEGTLEIWSTGSLIADGLENKKRGLLLTGGDEFEITGQGGIYLPVFLSSTDNPIVNYLHYDSEELGNSVERLAGSIASSTDIRTEINAANIAQVFTRTASPPINEITVRDMGFATAATIPPGKTLVLKGDGNTITNPFTIGGTLEIVEGAKLELSGTGAIAISAGGNLLNEGTINLVGTANTITVNSNGLGENNGTIKTVIVTPAGLNPLTSFVGTGSVEVTGTAIALAAGTLTLNNNLVLKGATKLTSTGATPFYLGNGEKKVVLEQGTIEFNSATGAYSGLPKIEISRDLGATNPNIKTTTAIHSGLQAIMDTVTLGGGVEVVRIEASGEIKGGAGLNDGLTANFVVPEDVELTVKGVNTKTNFDLKSSTHADYNGEVFNLEVYGALIFDGGGYSAVAPDGDVIIHGSLTTDAGDVITVSTGKTLEIKDLSKFTGAGKIDAANADPVIRIGGKEYTLTGSSKDITGAIASAAWDAITKVNSNFSDTIPVGIGAFGNTTVRDIAGTVNLYNVASGIADIKRSGNPNGSGAPLMAVTNVAFVAGSVGLDPVDGNLSSPATNFSLDSTGGGFQVDDAWISGGGNTPSLQEESGIVKFIDVEFEYNNSASFEFTWVLPEFNIGIITER